VTSDKDDIHFTKIQFLKFKTAVVCVF